MWGSAYVLMKKSLEVFSATELATLRLGIAAIALTPFALFHFKDLPRNTIGKVLLSGLMGNGIPAFLFANAQTKIDSTLAGILNALTPVFVLLIGLILFRQKSSRVQILGIFLGFLGVFTLFVSKGKIQLQNVEYSLLVVLATFLYGMNLNYVRNQLHHVSSIIIGSISIVIIGYFCLFYLIYNGMHNTIVNRTGAIDHLWYVGILAVVGTAFSNILFYNLIKMKGPVFSSMITFLMPFVSLLWGFAIGEKLGWQLFACMGLILTGVYLVTKKTSIT